MKAAVDALLRKELRLELRAPQAVPAMALFSVTTLVVFHFALQRGQVEGDLA
jgi:heme exporter protein B